MTLLIGFAVRSSILLALGLLLSACLAKRSAALRHRVLAGSLLAAVLVPPLSLVIPEWNVTLPAPVATAGPIERLSSPAQPASSPRLPSVAAPSSSIATAPHPPREPLVFVLVAWACGVVVAALTVIAGLVRVGRVAARAVRIENEAWLRTLESLARDYGLRREVVLARTDSPDLLATWGILRPAVLVPRHAHEWTQERVHVVLCHELAHIRRHDWLLQIGAEALRAILWFNPLAWMVSTRLRRESEQACDDEVLGIGVGAPAYAAELLDLARLCRRPRSAWAAALPMAHPSTLERRIAAMLNPRLDRRVPSRRAMAILSLVLLAVTVSTAALRARQAGPAPLTGTIYDASGAVLPGVEVTLVDANEVAHVATTNATGRFEFGPVNAGRYMLQTKLVGFRSLRQEVALAHGPDWDRAITLQVGDLQETITVRASRISATSGPAAAGPQPVRVGGNVKPPLKIKDVRPTFPAAMQAAGLSGTVPLEAILGRDGSVATVRVLSAQVHPDFAMAAIDAVRRWRFTPTLLNGQPVEVVMTVSITFDLE